jgi:hypothetical protein
MHSVHPSSELAWLHPSPLCITNIALAGEPATSFSPNMAASMIRLMKLQGGDLDAKHWGLYGHQYLYSRDLPPQLKQMQPSGVDAQGDEGRLRALEAATVARAEGGDWSSIARYLRESPAAGPLRPEERRKVEENAQLRSGPEVDLFSGSSPVPLEAWLLEFCARILYLAETVPRMRARYPALSVRPLSGA